MEKNLKLQEGETLKERYVIKSLIGSGGMGSTYLALDKSGDKEVALKVLALSEIKDWKVLELFEREVKALKNIDHPNIPDYVDNFEIDKEKDKYFILVQEYVNGQTLYQAIKEGQRFSLDKTLKIFKALLEILNYIHNLQPPVIHRDINPKNIILDTKGKVYLVDFGAVGQIVNETLAGSLSSTFVGTLGYMPPEQLYGKVSVSSDLYSLGTTMIFLFSGKAPAEFKLNKMKLAFHASLNLPEYLLELLDKMIEPDEDKRFSQALEVLKYLNSKKSVKKTLKGQTQDDLISDLFLAEKEGRFNEIAQTINKDLDVNAKNSQGISLLKIAFDKNALGMAQFLLEHGADLSLKYEGKTLLHEAVLSKKLEFAELFLQKGSEIDTQDDILHMSALDFAYVNKDPDFMELLLRHGAKDNPLLLKKGFTDLPPKRKITLKLLFRLMAVLGGMLKEQSSKVIVFSVCLTLFFLISAYKIPAIIGLWGVDAQAKGKVIKSEGTNVEVNDGAVYRIYYQFKDESNREYQGVSYLCDNYYSAGREVNVVYVQKNPNFSKIKGSWFMVIGNIAPLFLMLFVLFMIFLFIRTFFVKTHIKAIILLIKGLPAEASKVEHDDYTVYYEYLDAVNQKKKIWEVSE